VLNPGETGSGGSNTGEWAMGGATSPVHPAFD